MTDEASKPGFGRLIAAIKGVAQFADWLGSDAPAPGVKVLAPAGVFCAEPAPKGWVCVLREPHPRCVLERVKAP